LDTRAAPFDLDDVHAQWAERFRELNPSTFPHGGHRWCVPLRVGEHAVGVMVLADRVNGARYTVEELELLKCIGDQITSVLLNLRLAAEVASAKEFEAFRTMSTFFVHDLKNAAASLNLMLKNLPVHFDDPAFRADALRGIGNTTRRIEEMIERLSTFRDRPALAPVASDLNALVTEVLVGNAHDALQKGGEIRVRTEITRDRVLLSIADNGPGMPREFVEKHLFRPFQSTKKNGLGIGLFQCRAIVQAHGGGIHVDSGPDKGTTFTVSLPAGPTR
jgi:signal transduction histidine kinase